MATTNNKPATPSWRVSLAMWLAAWLAAFAIVTALYTAFGDQLAALPFAARALVISGVLVTVMMRLVLPVLSGAAGRWLARPDVSKLPSSEPSMKEADSDRQIHHPPLRSAR